MFYETETSGIIEGRKKEWRQKKKPQTTQTSWMKMVDTATDKADINRKEIKITQTTLCQWIWKLRWNKQLTRKTDLIKTDSRKHRKP